MSHQIPFKLNNFETYCQTLDRVGVDPGFLLYTNSHASNHKPVARLLHVEQLSAAETYIANASDEHFKRLVALGVFIDTEWERDTEHWSIISFSGWEVLHTAFNRLHVKSSEHLQQLTGISADDMMELN